MEKETMKEFIARTEPSKKNQSIFEQRGIKDNGQQFLIEQIKYASSIVMDSIDQISVPPDNAAEVGRLVSLAKTSLEESVMWATKAVSRFEKSKNL